MLQNKKPDRHSSYDIKFTNAQGKYYHLPTVKRASSDAVTSKIPLKEIQSTGRPKIITVYNALADPPTNMKVLLNHNSVLTFEQLVDDLYSAFAVNGKRSFMAQKCKLFSVSKCREVRSLTDLLRAECSSYVALGSKPLSMESIKTILDSVDSRGNDLEVRLGAWEEYLAKKKSKHTKREAWKSTPDIASIDKSLAAPNNVGHVRKGLSKSRDKIKIRNNENKDFYESVDENIRLEDLSSEQLKENERSKIIVGLPPKSQHQFRAPKVLPKNPVKIGQRSKQDRLNNHNILNASFNTQKRQSTGSINSDSPPVQHSTDFHLSNRDIKGEVSGLSGDGLVVSMRGVEDDFMNSQRMKKSLANLKKRRLEELERLKRTRMTKIAFGVTQTNNNQMHSINDFEISDELRLKNNNLSNINNDSYKGTSFRQLDINHINSYSNHIDKDDYKNQSKIPRYKPTSNSDKLVPVLLKTENHNLVKLEVAKASSQNIDSISKQRQEILQNNFSQVEYITSDLKSTNGCSNIVASPALSKSPSIIKKQNKICEKSTKNDLKSDSLNKSPIVVGLDHSFNSPDLIKSPVISELDDLLNNQTLIKPPVSNEFVINSLFASIKNGHSSSVNSPAFIKSPTLIESQALIKCPTSLQSPTLSKSSTLVEPLLDNSTNFSIPNKLSSQIQNSSHEHVIDILNLSNQFAPDSNVNHEIASEENISNSALKNSSIDLELKLQELSNTDSTNKDAVRRASVARQTSRPTSRLDSAIMPPRNSSIISYPNDTKRNSLTYKAMTPIVENKVNNNSHDIEDNLQINDVRIVTGRVSNDARGLSVMKSDKNHIFEHQVEATNNNFTRRLSCIARIEELFTIESQLGDGNFAVVKLVIDKQDGTKKALKIIDRSKMKGRETMIDNEIEILRECHHPNIVKLFADYETQTEILLVLEFIAGGDLFDLIADRVTFSESEAAAMTFDLARALFYLHCRSIVHRDIKPENILVENGPDESIRLKLTDFGLATKVESKLYLVCGTPTYVAPEILNNSGYELEIDIWALGVILYILLSGYPPFRADEQTDLFILIKTGKFEFASPYWDDISEDAKSLIREMLTVDRTKRSTTVDILCHVFTLTCGGITNLENTSALSKKLRLDLVSRMEKIKYKKDV